MITGSNAWITRWANKMELWGKWRRRARERRHLAEFSDAMLKDIGISRADAMAEFDKPFWRP